MHCGRAADILSATGTRNQRLCVELACRELAPKHLSCCQIEQQSHFDHRKRKKIVLTDNYVKLNYFCVAFYNIYLELPKIRTSDKTADISLSVVRKQR